MKTLLMLQVCFAYCPLLIESKVIVIVKSMYFAKVESAVKPQPQCSLHKML